MKRTGQSRLAMALMVSLGVSACTGNNDAEGVSEVADSGPNDVTGEPAPTKVEPTNTSPGKITAPISMDYEVMGNPIVGQPVQVNVKISSAAGPVMVNYSIVDESALSFQPDQVRSLEIADAAKTSNVQQITVIPQREGRVYVNVSAEVQTPGGSMIRSMAIPIKVGRAAEQPTINGELKKGPDGETVISMPAEESN